MIFFSDEMNMQKVRNRRRESFIKLKWQNGKEFIIGQSLTFVWHTKINETIKETAQTERQYEGR